MDDTVRAFYDQFAASYHLIFADWHASIERQAAVLDHLVRDALGSGPQHMLDCACGIGTQAVGLARLGHRVHATDLSPAAVARAEQEACLAGVSLSVAVADMRELEQQVPGTFDVVLACDNALPHLLTDDDLHRAAANIASKLRPGGLLLASIRDYDRLVQSRPRTEMPRVFDSPDGLRVAFQVWDWAPDGCEYQVHQFLLRNHDDQWRTEHVETRYRALLRADLDAALRLAGLGQISWLEPEESGYYQPVVTARA
ncbi:MAG: class I SAM-dependent methyltransferase [Thermomicrobiales bacterium]